VLLLLLLFLTCLWLTETPKVTLALCAAILVQEYALYAKHSGIPEIKTVLGGFVMKRFLGTWTLITKSFGLVCSSCSSLLTSAAPS
jgi:H+/Cl- antiporter ClcA